MKHGRRHDRLKEKAYLARKDAEGYARPYRPIDVAEGGPGARPPGEDTHPLAVGLSPRARRALRREGVDPDAS